MINRNFGSHCRELDFWRSVAVSARETSVSDNFGNLTSEFQKIHFFEIRNPDFFISGHWTRRPALLQKAALSELVDLHTVVRHMGQVQTLEPGNSQVSGSGNAFLLTIHCFDGSSILQLLNSTFGSRCSRNRQSSPHWYPAKSQFLSCVIWFCDGLKPLSCGLGLESVLSTAWRRNPSDSTPRSQRCPSWTSWRIGRTQGTCSENKSVNMQLCCSKKVKGMFLKCFVQPVKI